MLHFKKINNKAFSAMETVVYIGIFSLVLGAVSTLILNVYRMHYFSLTQSDAISNTRKALSIMLSAIREASFADNGAYPVEKMAPNEFIFYSDIDNDLKVERVRLFVDNHYLKMGVINSSGIPASYNLDNEKFKTIAQGVRNSDFAVDLFTYKNASSSAITDLNNILDLRVVDLRILIDLDPGRSPGFYDFRTSAALRNIVNTYNKW